MSVLTDIIEWSVGRPMWQRDALRRIITQGKLTEGDVAALTRICLAENGIDDPENPADEPIPLAEQHLPPSGRTADRVRLISLHDVQGVNALAGGQRLSFGPHGMTIVFGYNGSGKSGYARILRSLCHARCRGSQILKDAFAHGIQPNPSATLDYKVGSSDKSIAWVQGTIPPPELRRVGFFDADCAAVHVDEENELAFTPFGLDVLPKLASACLCVSRYIADRIAALSREQPASLAAPQAADGTQVHNMLQTLNENSDMNSFRTVAGLPDRDRDRLQEVYEALGADPNARARELLNKVTRLQRLNEATRKANQTLCPEAVENIRILLQAVRDKKAAAQVAAEQAFGSQPLSGVGEPVWQELWQAAKKYSGTCAYRNRGFPFVGEGARCVLCQQPLDLDAQKRLTAFDAFVKAETQQELKRAEQELERAAAPIRALDDARSTYHDFLSDIPEDQDELKRSTRRFHVVARLIKRRIIRSMAEEQWIAPPSLMPSPEVMLDALISDTTRRVRELEQAATDEKRQALLEERGELLARQWLGGVLEDIEAEIKRKKKLASHYGTSPSTDTTWITRKNGELTDTYVTGVLRNRLVTECQNLGAGYLQVELDSPGGKHGAKRFKVSLHGIKAKTAMSDVLSEGEFRCIALAGFLTELSTEQSNSALVFDDPVCSLDHNWRRKVALRLTQLAGGRQVIVFTHDIVFLTDLEGFCGIQDVPLKLCYLLKGAEQPGECIDDVPWIAMKVSKRIGWLKSLLQQAETLYRKQGRIAYEPEAQRIYGLLRETWERAVEEVLLNGAVIRFDRAVHTQQLSKIADITDNDIRTINEGMTKASRFLEGHDEAQAVADPVPEPTELHKDIERLDNWVTEVNKRRK